ncbi:MAG: ABA4-like family protein [Maribacter sp.]
MNPETVFSIANMIALPMWILMILLPNWKVTRWLIDYKVIPLALALMYAVYIVMALITGGMMDFGTLDSVMQLFTDTSGVLAGWIHYLAFDLLVGMWILEQQKQVGIHKALLAICLLGTFMFGPLGFLLFMIMKAFKTRKHIVQ